MGSVEKAPKFEHNLSEENLEVKSGHETHKPVHEHAHETKIHSKEDIEKLAREALENAGETPPFPVEAEHAEDKVQAVGSHQALKKDAYKDILAKTRSRLPKVERVFSKVVHSKTIESASNAAAATAARPSGLLGGAVGAFIGSSTLLYFAKHYGFNYNFGAFLAMFAAGFAAGLVLEVVFKLLFKRKHR